MYQVSFAEQIIIAILFHFASLYFRFVQFRHKDTTYCFDLNTFYLPILHKKHKCYRLFDFQQVFFQIETKNQIIIFIIRFRHY